MKKSWKMFLPLVICLALCMSLFTVSASAASKSTPGAVVKDDDGNWVAVDKKGNPVSSGWVSETWKDESTGKMQKSWYYVSSKGELVTGWQNVDGNWYFFEDQTDDTTKPWMYANSGKFGPAYFHVEGEEKSTNAFNTAKNFYWFNEDGTIGGQSGWKSFVTTDKDGNPYRAWFYVNSDGTVAKGWKDDAGNWYELGYDYPYGYVGTAEAVTGGKDKINITNYPNIWVDDVNGTLSPEDWKTLPAYWVNPDGTIVMNDWASFKDFEDFDPNKDPHRYWVFADEKGELVQGWNNIDGTWYYFGVLNPETEKPYEYTYHMQENTDLKMDGNVYRVGKLGALVTGWSENPESGNWNYFDPATGAEVQDQWKQIDGKWYYFDGADAVNDGFFEYDGDQYYLGKDGVMQTGWVAENPGEWYKFGDDGVQQFGWVEDGGNWYYLDENTGELAVNTWTPDGEYAASDGAWIAETPAD